MTLSSALCSAPSPSQLLALNCSQLISALNCSPLSTALSSQLSVSQTSCTSSWRHNFNIEDEASLAALRSGKWPGAVVAFADFRDGLTPFPGGRDESRFDASGAVLWGRVVPDVSEI